MTEWRPIESAPKDGSKSELAWLVNGKLMQTVTTRWHNDRWTVWFFEATHWRHTR